MVSIREHRSYHMALFLCSDTSDEVLFLDGKRSVGIPIAAVNQLLR
jgi:hypothetical protein